MFGYMLKTIWKNFRYIIELAAGIIVLSNLGPIIKYFHNPLIADFSIKKNNLPSSIDKIIIDQLKGTSSIYYLDLKMALNSLQTKITANENDSIINLIKSENTSQIVRAIKIISEAYNDQDYLNLIIKNTGKQTLENVVVTLKDNSNLIEIRKTDSVYTYNNLMKIKLGELIPEEVINITIWDNSIYSSNINDIKLTHSKGIGKIRTFIELGPPWTAFKIWFEYYFGVIVIIFVIVVLLYSSILHFVFTKQIKKPVNVDKDDSGNREHIESYEESNTINQEKE